MATQVIKKDGARQPFDAEKIRKAISMACSEAGCTEDRKMEVVAKVSAQALVLADAKDEITTSELREKILSELDIMEPSAAQAWRAHDQERKEQ